jgi:ATP-dependent Clp protease ATP-binding subunit ClpA
MAASQGPLPAAYRAWEEARRLDHGWVGIEHVLLALFAEPSPATEALQELGVTRDLAEEHARTVGRAEPPGPAYDPAKGLSPNPAWYMVTGCATGLALAAGRRHPKPEHFLLAMLYRESDPIAELLHAAGTSARALVDALARRGVAVPAVDPPVYRPLRGHHRIDVTEAELKGVLKVLLERHPAGSEWRWGFNWYPDDPQGGPRRAWVGGEEGVDLEDALATARARAGS